MRLLLREWGEEERKTMVEYINWGLSYMKTHHAKMKELGLDIDYDEFQKWDTKKQIEYAMDYFEKVNKPVLEEVEAWVRKQGSQLE